MKDFGIENRKPCSAHMPAGSRGWKLKSFTAPHQFDGEQSSINERVVLFRETANPFCGPGSIASHATATLRNSFKRSTH